jgi:phage gp16-like protein
MSNAYPAAMRNRIIAKIHVAKKQLSLCDDEYRAIIAGASDGLADSCKDCTEYQLDTILRLLEVRGFKPVVKASKIKLSPTTKDKIDKDQVDKIRALWIDLANQGVVRNRSDDAISKFAKRLTKVDRLEWLTVAQCQTVIAALNAMSKKDDGVKSEKA